MQKITKPSRRPTKGQDFRSGKGELRMPSSAPGAALNKRHKADSKHATNACFTDHRNELETAMEAVESSRKNTTANLSLQPWVG